MYNYHLLLLLYMVQANLTRARHKSAISVMPNTCCRMQPCVLPDHLMNVQTAASGKTVQLAGVCQMHTS